MLLQEFDAAKSHASALSWNTSPFDPPMMCVAAEREVRVWEYNANARRWLAVAGLEGHGDLVHDVCWAPNLGRAYHLVATACKDACVRIYKLSYSKAAAAYTPTMVAKLAHHSAEVWRVSWNVSGTILASTGDDGVSRLWKSDFNGTWHPILVAAATPAAAGAGLQNPAIGSTSAAAPTAAASASAASSSAALAPQLNRFQSAPQNAAAGSSMHTSPFYAPTAAAGASSSSSAYPNTHSSSALPFGFGSNNFKTAPIGSSMFGDQNANKQQRVEEEVKFADHRSMN